MSQIVSRIAPVEVPRAPRPTSVFRLVVAWMLVGVPLAWGVSQVFQKSLALFR